MFLNLEARKKMIEEMDIKDTKKYVHRCVLAACKDVPIKPEFYSTHKILPQWYPLVQRALEDPNWTPTEHSRLCNVHFDAKDIRRSGRSNRLNFNAVPKNFMEPPEIPIDPLALDPLAFDPLDLEPLALDATATTTTTTNTTDPISELTSIPDTIDVTDLDLVRNLEGTSEKKPIPINIPKRSTTKCSTKKVRNPIVKVNNNSKKSKLPSVSPINKICDSQRSSSTVENQLPKVKDAIQELEDYKILVAQTLVKLKRQKRRIQCLEALNRKLKLQVKTKSATSIKSSRLKKRSGKSVKKLNKS